MWLLTTFNLGADFPEILVILTFYVTKSLQSAYNHESQLKRESKLELEQWKLENLQVRDTDKTQQHELRLSLMC